MKLRDIVLNGIALLFVAGCGPYSHRIQNGIPNIGPVDPTPLKQDIVSMWASKCVPTGKTSSAQEIVRFDQKGNRYQYQQSFNNSSCQGSQATLDQIRAASKPVHYSISNSYVYGAGSIHFKSEPDVNVIISGKRMAIWDRSKPASTAQIFTRIK